MNGWIILDKPLGLGSTNAVSAVKRALRNGGYPKVKVGHGGTLDPLATGVLPIALGEATKLAGRMLDASKVYEFTIAFGTQTDTLDAEGAVVATSEARPTSAQVEAVLPRFTGDIEQVPPAYSALKVDGARAYDLARAGEAVELATRRVTVFSLNLREEKEEQPSPRPSPAKAGEGEEATSPYSVLANECKRAFPSSPSPAFAGEGRDEGLLPSITITAHVSKGTYIRSLARDIALALGTVGHVTMLRRTRAGPFDLRDAISLDKLDATATARGLEGVCLPLEAGLDGIPALPLTPVQAGLVRQGRVLDGIVAPDGLYLGVHDGIPVALIEADAGSLRVVRGFNL